VRPGTGVGGVARRPPPRSGDSGPAADAELRAAGTKEVPRVIEVFKADVAARLRGLQVVLVRQVPRLELSELLGVLEEMGVD